jgi:hypothetical protein
MGNNIVAARHCVSSSRKRASFVPSLHAETQQEQEFLDLYRSLSPQNKAAILAAVRPLAGLATSSTSVMN